MANVLTSNPVYIDTAAGSTISDVKIQQIQWLDDANDVADGDDLSFTINGVTVAIKQNLGSDVGFEDTIIYQAGPFAKPILVNSFVVGVIDHGVVLVWLA